MLVQGSRIIIVPWLAALSAVCGAALPIRAFAQCQSQHVPSTPDGLDGLGGPTALSGDYAAVYRILGPDLGGFQMLRRNVDTNSWLPTEVIVSPQPEPGDSFGASIAIDRDVLVVGATLAGESDAGQVHVYRLNPMSDRWAHEATLTASNATRGQRFGNDVDVDGETIVVGASGGSDVAYIFEHDPVDGWTERAILTDGGAGFRFGERVQVSENLIAVSGTMPVQDKTLNKLERIFLFRRGGIGEDWINDGFVERPDPSPAGGFGAAFALDGDTLAVGALSQTLRIGVHVFQRNPETNSWDYQSWLIGSGMFATLISTRRWISLDGDDLLFNDRRFESPYHSMLFVCARDPKTGAWHRSRAIEYPTGSGRGLWPSVESGRAVVSQSLAISGKLTFPGDAYFFDLSSPDCNGNLWCDDIDIATGSSSDTNANNVPDECDGPPGDVTGDLRVDVDDLVTVILGWGACQPLPMPCPADANRDADVDAADLILVVLNWTG